MGPTAAHAGRPWGCERWEARLVVVELAALEEIVRDPDGAGHDLALALATPRLRDRRLAEGFLALHATLEAPAWALDRDVALGEWLRELVAAPDAPVDVRAARRDPAVRRACELLNDDLAANLTLAQLADAAGVSRHRLTRRFRAAYGLPPHRFALAQRSVSPAGCWRAASRPPRSPSAPASSTRATCTATSAARSA